MPYAVRRRYPSVRHRAVYRARSYRPSTVRRRAPVRRRVAYTRRR